MSFEDRQHWELKRKDAPDTDTMTLARALLVRHGGGSHDDEDHGNWADGTTGERLMVAFIEGGRGYSSGGVADFGGSSGTNRGGTERELPVSEYVAEQITGDDSRHRISVKDMQVQQGEKFYYVDVDGSWGPDPDFPEDGITGIVDLSVDGKSKELSLGYYGEQFPTMDATDKGVADWIEETLPGMFE